jgi:hypothetical protein
VTPPSGERVLAWANGPSGLYIATDLAFHVPEPLDPQRVAWHLIDRASWRDPFLDVGLHAQVGTPLLNWKLELSEPGRLPEVVRERVTASVITSLDVELVGGKARIAARRTETNATRWSVTPLDGANLADPESRAEASQLIKELAASLGI